MPEETIRMHSQQSLVIGSLAPGEHAPLRASPGHVTAFIHNSASFIQSDVQSVYLSKERQQFVAVIHKD